MAEQVPTDAPPAPLPGRARTWPLLALLTLVALVAALMAWVPAGMHLMLGPLLVAGAWLAWRIDRARTLAYQRSEAALRSAEAAARANEAQYRAMVAALNEGVVIFDARARAIAANPAAERLLGVSQAHMTLQRTSPDAWPALRPDGSPMPLHELPLSQLLATREAQHDRLVGYRHPDGRLLWLQISAVPWFDDDGRTLRGGVLSFTDITERRHAEDELARHRTELERRVDERTAALQASDALLRTVADNIPGRVAYWQPDGQCRFANRHACEWYGLTPETMTGRRVLDLLSPDTRAAVRPHLEAVMRGEPQSFEVEELRPDGQRMHTLVNYVPDWRGDQVLGGLSLAVDVTALRMSERRLLEMNDALTLARDRAEQANQAKTAFLANMSHEIRTPMNAIIGLTHLLQRDVAASAGRGRLAKVADAANHLLALVNDILDLSKIEAGKLTLEQADFEPARLIERTVALVSERAQVKRLSLKVDAPGLPPRLSGDPTRLAQALLNLLSNAVKFTDRGEVRLSARARPLEGRRWRLDFEVADTGIGIMPEVQARLFTAFEQADTSMTRRFGGTGLGLAITRSLVHLMGGEIEVDSRPGAGSVFRFHAEFEPAVAVGAAEAAAPAAQGAEATLAGRAAGTRVLLAEDNVVNQEVALELLRAVNLEVDVAAHGREAVQMALARPYALILMDVQMPELDGLQATRELRASPAGREVPILAMTANAFSEDRLACLAAGMNDHIAKPVDPPVLYATLLRWLPEGSLGPRPRPQADGGADVLERLRGIDGFDPTVALRVSGLRPSALVGVLARFVRLYRTGLPALDRLSASGETRELARLAHSLRGACATVGAQRLQAMAETLESLCGVGAAPAALQPASAAVRRELALFVAALEARLELAEST